MLANIFLDLYFILRSRRKGMEKFKVFILFIYFTLKFIFPYRILGIKFKRGRVFGFNVNFFDFRSFYYFFRTIFVHEDYYFFSEASSPLIIDCGSNIGFSVLYFKSLYPNSRIIAFEPDPKSFEMLKKNVNENRLKDVELKNCALFSEAKELEFHIDPCSPGNPNMSIYPQRIKGEKITVSSVLLSEFINERVDFLKLDIEGAELEVLKELSEKGKLGFIKEMVVEYHHHIHFGFSFLKEILKLGTDAGFSYQIQALEFPFQAKFLFQDILIYFYQKDGRG